MSHDDLLDRFHRLANRYNALHRPGATRRLKAELGLGSGPFNDQLTVNEVEEMADELESRVSTSE